MASGIACGECGHEWFIPGVPPAAPPPGLGPCGAHVGGRPCPDPRVFANQKLHFGCDHMADRCVHGDPLKAAPEPS